MNNKMSGKGDILLFASVRGRPRGRSVNSGSMRRAVFFRQACTGLLDKFDEPLVVVILVKHILPRVAAVQNVVANPSDGSSGGSWHSSMLP